jgi:hypothetical protein
MEFVLTQRHPGGDDALLGEVISWERFGTGFSAGGERWVLPALACGSVHPIVAWYGVLYAFSMLARYQPVAWRSHLDIDSSRYAAALQRTLDLAVSEVPVLVEDVLATLGHRLLEV